MIFLNGSLPSYEVVNLVDKLTHGYHVAISTIVSIVAVVIAFAIWDRATIKKDVQADFERTLKETVKQQEERFNTELLELQNSLKNEMRETYERVMREKLLEFQEKHEELLEAGKELNQTYYDEYKVQTDNVKKMGEQLLEAFGNLIDLNSK